MRFPRTVLLVWWIAVPATAFLMISAFSRPLLACSAFMLERGPEKALGRNYDWEIGDGMLLVNPAGLQKSGMTAGHPARWTSHFGSVTLNQFGREMPLEGMNEAGLAIATLWLDETALPSDTTAPSLGSLQWVQFMLDQCSTVGQVLEKDETVVIAPGAGSTVHFFVADSSGASAVVEYVGGKRVHHSGSEMEVEAITNDSYSRSREFLAGLETFGGHDPVPTDMGSLARFARCAVYQKCFAAKQDGRLVDFGFSALAAVSSGMHTQWSVVYDLKGRRISFRTQGAQQIRWLDMKDANSRPGSPARMISLNSTDMGDLSAKLVPYTTEANRELIFRVYRGIDFLRDVPDELLEQLARFPETLHPAATSGG